MVSTEWFNHRSTLRREGGRTGSLNVVGLASVRRAMTEDNTTSVGSTTDDCTSRDDVALGG